MSWPKDKPKPAAKKKTPIPKGVARALAERKPNADSEALLNELIKSWGGVERFAADVFQEFQHAAKGGMTRQRILEMMQRLILTNTTHEIGKAIRPADLTDEELETLAMKYVKKASGADAPVQQPLAGPIASPESESEENW